MRKLLVAALFARLCLASSPSSTARQAALQDKARELAAHFNKDKHAA
jgi:hypothetical protein